MNQMQSPAPRVALALFGAMSLACFITASTAQEGLDKTTEEWVTGPAYVAPEIDEKLERAVRESHERSRIARERNTEELFELTDEAAQELETEAAQDEDAETDS
jgi:hypothetical protein